MTEREEPWDLVVESQNALYKIDISSVWHYKDLILLLVRRDFVSLYKQTILGPLWFLIQPILTSITFTIIFGNIAKISTDGNPGLLFYMAGVTMWTYFADCLNKTSTTFLDNASVFGKVYFPRLIMPLSVLISNLIKLGVQLLIFISIWSYFLTTTHTLNPQWQQMWLIPILIFILAGLGLGLGILISSLTAKYRDLTFLISFGVQLLMYASSVVIPISSMSEKTKFIMLLNPVTSIIEAFKYIFLGSGFFDYIWLFYSIGIMIIIVSFSIIIFNKTEKTFMDTV